LGKRRGCPRAARRLPRVAVMGNKPKYKRILLKLGGEALAGPGASG